MTKQIRIELYSDPGHAWGKVKLELLRELQIAGDISRYSYLRKDYAYLEEDRDLPIALQAIEEAGVLFKLVQKRSNRTSKIRKYTRYPSLLMALEKAEKLEIVHVTGGTND